MSRYYCPVLDLTHGGLCRASAQRYFAGDDWSVRVTFADSDGPIDLTGMTFRATIGEGETAVVRSSDDSAQIEILDQGDDDTKGRIRIRVARSEPIAAGLYPIDIVRIAADGSEQTWAIGRFESKARVTETPIQ